MKKWKKEANRDFSCLWIGRVNIVTITFLNSVCVCTCIWANVCTCHIACVWRAEDHCGSWFSPSSMWVLGQNSGYQTWWQVPLSTEPSPPRAARTVLFHFFFQCGYINANLVIVPGSYFMGLVIVILAQTRVTWEEVASVEFLPSDWLVSSYFNKVGGSSPL